METNKDSSTTLPKSDYRTRNCKREQRKKPKSMVEFEPDPIEEFDCAQRNPKSQIHCRNWNLQKTQRKKPKSITLAEKNNII